MYCVGMSVVLVPLQLACPEAWLECGSNSISLVFTVDFSAAFEHSLLHAGVFMLLENVAFYIAVYGPYKP